MIKFFYTIIFTYDTINFKYDTHVPPGSIYLRLRGGRAGSSLLGHVNKLQIKGVGTFIFNKFIHMSQ